jgi:hypothetical protein
MIDLLRLIELASDCLLVLVGENNGVPIMLPMLRLLVELTRLLELAAGCCDSVGEGILSVPNMFLLLVSTRFVES